MKLVVNYNIYNLIIDFGAHTLRLFKKYKSPLDPFAFAHNEFLLPLSNEGEWKSYPLINWTNKGWKKII